MKSEYADQYANHEENHWWFRARAVILKNLLGQHVDWKPGMKVLEVGTGPGINLERLYPESADLYGLEPDAGNAEIANARKRGSVYCGTVENIPEELTGQTYDVICLFDVLEHIEDDLGALSILNDLLAPGGQIAISVPTYMWMWGKQDVANMHYRRYTRKELCDKLRKQGFTVQRSTYFNTILFPPIALFRVLSNLLPKKNQKDSDIEYTVGPLDNLLYGLFRLEWPLLKYMSFPFGVSCMAVARK